MKSTTKWRKEELEKIVNKISEEIKKLANE